MQLSVKTGGQKHAAEDSSGDLQPDKGCLLIDGEEKISKSAREAIASGISVIYQERQVLPYLSVARIYLWTSFPLKKPAD